jgi:ABC-type spermidine/putrescine transport system permease subunit II
MLSPRRRLTIVITSVALGTFAAALLWKSRYGTLKQENINQLLFNFIFAVGIVIGIGILLGRMNKKNDGDIKK